MQGQDTGVPTAAIQNIQIRLKYGNDRRKTVAFGKLDGEFRGDITGLLKGFKRFLSDSFSLGKQVIDRPLLLGTR
jgi:hypothetical protein